MDGEGRDEIIQPLLRTESRWVDGSEVQEEWLLEDEASSSSTSRGDNLTRRKLIKRAKRVDSFDVEAMDIAGAHAHHDKEISIGRTLYLAFQTLGVVYGDLGTSPLYVFSSVFKQVPISEPDDVLGALSLVMYTIALVPLTKYVFIVLKANNNGEGGTFSLYSLISRYANVSMLPNRQPSDEKISSFRLKLPSPEMDRALRIKDLMERSSTLKTLLLLLVLMGTSMVIGDGILTPAISVMSAVSGLQDKFSSFNQDEVVITAIVFLVILFSIQQFGTAKVGLTFAPALSLWFFSLGAIGLYNIISHDVTVLRAFNPIYIYYFFKRNTVKAWLSLGGCVLCITGIAEVGVMMVTTSLVTIVMVLIWQINIFLAIGFPLLFGSIELIYFSAVLMKVTEGGWLPLAFACVFLLVMFTWNYGSVLKYQSEVRQKLSMDLILELGSSLGTVRVPGIGLVYSELVRGVPAVFGQFLTGLPAIHSTIIFVCIKYVPVPVVPQGERFLFRRICPKDYHMFRCIARYGYKDIRKEHYQSFEELLIESLEKFLRKESLELALEKANFNIDSDDESVNTQGSNGSNGSTDPLRTPLMADQRLKQGSVSQGPSTSSSLPTSAMSMSDDPGLEYDLSSLREAKESGVVYLVGHGDVRAKKNSWFIKKLAINYFYAFMRRNCRASTANLSVPHTNLLQVGMTYMV
ncbi:putative potassium transporter 12 isoform X2 [Cryptomeria japonica]|uniref:putative potassium transporter 12 isoform X2 n=1 Tax=Cryptomeria japonica TaxID=3369 RepID=UPI0025AB73C5|nr:putative potassium transporter 12 isoform X2 [Cryptomeria japonica]